MKPRGARKRNRSTPASPGATSPRNAFRSCTRTRSDCLCTRNHVRRIHVPGATSIPIFQTSSGNRPRIRWRQRTHAVSLPPMACALYPSVVLAPRQTPGTVARTRFAVCVSHMPRSQPPLSAPRGASVLVSTGALDRRGDFNLRPPRLSHPAVGSNRTSPLRSAAPFPIASPPSLATQRAVPLDQPLPVVLRKSHRLSSPSQA